MDYRGNIQSIVPAPNGWFAVYVEDDGNTIRYPVACWAMVEWTGAGGGSIVVGMGADPGGRELDFMDGGNFLGYAGPDDPTDWKEIGLQRLQEMKEER